MIISSIIIGAIAAFFLSSFILRLYKRAVIKGMNLSVPSFKEIEQTNETHLRSNQKIDFIQTNDTAALYADSINYQQLCKFLNNRLVIYAVSILCFALSWSYIYLNVNAMTMNLNQVIYCIVIFFWPFVFSQNIIWSNDRKQKSITYGSYFASFIVLSLIIYLFQDVNFQLILLLVPRIIYNALPTILILLIRIGKIRSISTIVTAFCFIAFLTACLSIIFFSSNHDALKKTSNLIYDIGLHSTSFFFLLLFALSCIIGAVLIFCVKRLYISKQINEQQLTLDAILLIFTAFYSISILSHNPSLLLGTYCFLPFVFYKLLTLILFKILRVQNQNKTPIKLLLLRVFALNKASRISFEKMQRHWQYAGPILMISGPDLATTTIDAHEMADFVTNNLKKHFCDIMRISLKPH